MWLRPQSVTREWLTFIRRRLKRPKRPWGLRHWFSRCSLRMEHSQCATRTIELLLAVLKKGEEEEPEHAHCVPVPDGGVHRDLPRGELAGAREEAQRRDQCGDADEKVRRVRDGDQVEKVTTGVGVEEDMLRGELRPGDPLAD